MKLGVIGASRGIGRLTVVEALRRGHAVRAVSRSGLDGAEGVEDIRADATDPAALEAALVGLDAVLLTLGIPRRFDAYMREVRLFSTVTQALLPAMARQGVRRLLAVTGFGAGDSKQAMSRPERIGHSLLLGRPYADKDRQEALIRASDLDWTLVRPVILTYGPASGAYRVLDDPKTWRNGLISRADVAHFLVREAAEDAYVRRAVVLAR